MPYIKEDIRAATRDNPDTVRDAGSLNYLITKLAVWYVKFHGLSYSSINDVMGALDGAKSEFYRRVAVPYEDSKMKENGDVYENINI